MVESDVWLRLRVPSSNNIKVSFPCQFRCSIPFWCKTWLSVDIWIWTFKERARGSRDSQVGIFWKASELKVGLSKPFQKSRTFFHSSSRWAIRVLFGSTRLHAMWYRDVKKPKGSFTLWLTLLYKEDWSWSIVRRYLSDWRLHSLLEQLVWW